PDPLTMFDGRRVTNQEQWVQERRPELKALFQHYMYGSMPPGHGTWEVVHLNPVCFGGKATKKEVVITLDLTNAPRFNLLVVTPNNRPGPVPVFVGPNFCGNHAVLAEPSVALPTGWMPSSCAGCKGGKATEGGRGSEVNTW